jgi:predicted metalloprotease with PDZ domain
MWATHGKPGGPQPGLVAKPYTLQDAQDRLAEVSGDRAFAADFFAKYVAGHEVADYQRLLSRAGLVLRRRYAGRAWLGSVQVDPAGLVTSLIAPNTPAIAAGFDQDDRIVRVDGQPYGDSVTVESIVSAHQPGDRIQVEYRHPDGATGTGVMTLGEDPTMEIVALESDGGRITPAQQAFRAAWLDSRQAGR